MEGEKMFSNPGEQIPPPPPQENSEAVQEERRKKLVKLFEKSMDAKGSIGYHGTSLEAIEYLIEHGYLPGRKFDNTGSNQNFVYFYPRKSAFPKNSKLTGDYIPDEKLIEDTSTYSKSVAGAHYFMKAFGLDIADSEVEDRAGALLGSGEQNWKPAEQYFLDKGIQKEKLYEVIELARKRKGVVLSLKKKILKEHEVSRGDVEGEDVKIAVPEGLSLEMLAGLEPMGEQEFDYFEKLQEGKK